MLKLPWPLILAWLLTVFFIFGGLGNIIAPPSIAQEYQGWGFPDWFHLVTGTCELATALLLAVPATRLSDAALGCGVMLSAAAVVLFHGELAHAIAPLAVFALLAVGGWMTLRSRRVGA